MHQDLRNQVAVVTGGTRGIGAAIARALLMLRRIGGDLRTERPKH